MAAAWGEILYSALEEAMRQEVMMVTMAEEGGG